MIMNKINTSLLLLFVSYSIPALAEIDKIYHPYVEAYKSEIEYRTLYKNDNNAIRDGVQFHRLSFGHSITERFSMEAYVIAKNLPNDSLSINGFELEGKLQLTEQGEFWSDWGMLFEIERDTQLNKWEGDVGLLWEKQWGKWIGSINFFTGYEFGSGIEDEIETVFHSQMKYRWSRYLEPAIELYMDENARGLGPVFLGTQKLGINKLRWELGIIFGLNSRTADQNLRFLLDFEF